MMASTTRTGYLTLRCSPITHNNVRRISNNKMRNFSTTHEQSASIPRVDIARAMPKQQSMGTRMKNMKISEVPTDIGIIPSTMIRPSWGEGPSLFSSEWKQRVIIDWVAAKQTFSDFIAKIMESRWSKKDIVTGKRNKLPLWLRERRQEALTLHTQLYKAIAEGDKTIIRKICSTGLLQQQLTDIDQRKIQSAQPSSWSVKYKGFKISPRIPWSLQWLIPFKAVRIVADRQVSLPFGDKNILRQTTVRIRSRQHLDRNDGSDPITKDITEYLVLQRLVLDKQIGPWRVWGTRKPSTYQDAENIRNLRSKSKEVTGGLGQNLSSKWSETMNKMPSL